jgi:hypothetical protein
LGKKRNEGFSGFNFFVYHLHSDVAQTSLPIGLEMTGIPSPEEGFFEQV